MTEQTAPHDVRHEPRRLYSTVEDRPTGDPFRSDWPDRSRAMNVARERIDTLMRSRRSGESPVDRTVDVVRPDGLIDTRYTVPAERGLSRRERIHGAAPEAVVVTDYPDVVWRRADVSRSEAWERVERMEAEVDEHIAGGGVPDPGFLARLDAFREQRDAEREWKVTPPIAFRVLRVTPQRIYVEPDGITNEQRRARRGGDFIDRAAFDEGGRSSIAGYRGATLYRDRDRAWTEPLAAAEAHAERLALDARRAERRAEILRGVVAELGLTT